MGSVVATRQAEGVISTFCLMIDHLNRWPWEHATLHLFIRALNQRPLGRCNLQRKSCFPDRQYDGECAYDTSWVVGFVVFVAWTDVQTESELWVMCSHLGDNVTTVETLDVPIRHLINSRTSKREIFLSSHQRNRFRCFISSVQTLFQSVYIVRVSVSVCSPR